MQITISFIIAILGALIYAYAGNAKAQEIGRLIFFCGFLWFVHALSNGRITFGR